jgi:ribosome-associated protein
LTGEPRSYTSGVLNSLEQAQRIAALAQEKLASDVVILDMRPVCTYTDFFIVCTGKTARQTKAIWDEVHSRLKHEGRQLPRSIDGEREATWIIADYLDVVLHVFTPEARGFYRLEDLWGDVPSVEDAASTA